MCHNEVPVAGEIIANGEVAPENYLLSVELPQSFPTPAPGQFVMVRAADRDEPLLSRPLSVYGFHRNPNYAVLDLLYRVCGKGTTLLSRLDHGDRLQILGPLGHGFDMAPHKQNIILAVPAASALRPLLIWPSITGFMTGQNPVLTLTKPSGKSSVIWGRNVAIVLSGGSV